LRGRTSRRIEQQACTQHRVGGLNCVRVPIGQIRVRQSPLFGA
jgi:hypothetical protein